MGEMADIKPNYDDDLPEPEEDLSEAPDTEDDDDETDSPSEGECEECGRLRQDCRCCEDDDD